MAEYSMGEALQAFLNKSRIRGDIQALRIEDIWKDIMGITVAKYTDKLQIIGNKLFIYTAVAPLRNELHFQKEKIIERVNEALGQQVISEVVLK
ncbi:MAG TPA: DUF721 domain-containing protein [Niabella sp.]|nr:DUF721 domain-containing protein [Niabella sp.]HQW14936.1 DUF721 domain-containing protein [Niabella sp.]HQX20172.1 DUF721 domain-containing protein [Niabella sp.]HQX41928.1 DUF721 domain-containing protein [Niabella sp.]HRB06777.1 DUF721 domain-containing protein [Niabella sp.]